MITPFHPWFAYSRCCCCCCCYCVSSYYSRSILFKVRAQSKRLRMSITRLLSSRFNGPPDEGGKALLMGFFLLFIYIFFCFTNSQSRKTFLCLSFLYFFVSLFGHLSSLRYEKVIHPWIVFDAFYRAFYRITVFIVAKV